MFGGGGSLEVSAGDNIVWERMQMLAGIWGAEQ